MIEASALKPGQWLITKGGAYLVDGVTVKAGLVYIGTNRGVAVMPVQTPVLVGLGED